MRTNAIAFALSVAFFAHPLMALAQEAAVETEEETSNLSWNLTLTSDYVFRGISQTSENPALQGGLDYAFGESGFYTGVWASNVDFDDSDGPNIELDGTAGWGMSLSDDWSLDLHFVRYFYFGENSAYGSIDYNEYFISTSFREMLTFTAAYADDYSNSGVSSQYYAVDGSWDVGHEFNLSAGLGYSKFSEGTGDYTDWSLGLSRQFGPVEIDLTYHDTDGSYVDEFYPDGASNAVVLSFNFGG